MASDNTLQERAIEPIARCMIRQLAVPDIYFQVELPLDKDTLQIDVLAIDRAGSGDAHAIEIKRKASDALQAIPKLLNVNIPYRWVAYYADTLDASVGRRIKREACLRPRIGAGKVGVIELIRMENSELGARINVMPERFIARESRTFVAELISGRKPDITFE